MNFDWSDDDELSTNLNELRCPTNCGNLLNPEIALNYKSRYYTGVMLCSTCGQYELANGEFQNWPMSMHSKIIKEQRKWIKILNALPKKKEDDK